MTKSREEFENRFKEKGGGWSVTERRSQLLRYEILTALIKNLETPPAKILDLGCAEGFFAGQYLNDLNAKIIGLDISNLAVERARSEYPHIEFHQGSILNIPWNEFSWNLPNLVVLSEVLYYLDLEERKKCVDDVFHHMPNGGHLLLSVNLGPPPYFTHGELDQLFSKFQFVYRNGIFLKSYYQKIESRLVAASRRLPFLRPFINIYLRHFPVDYLHQLKKSNPTEELIHYALLVK